MFVFLLYFDNEVRTVKRISDGFKRVVVNFESDEFFFLGMKFG